MFTDNCSFPLSDVISRQKIICRLCVSFVTSLCLPILLTFSSKNSRRWYVVSSMERKQTYGHLVFYSTRSGRGGKHFWSIFYTWRNLIFSFPILQYFSMVWGCVTRKIDCCYNFRAFERWCVSGAGAISANRREYQISIFSLYAYILPILLLRKAYLTTRGKYAFGIFMDVRSLDERSK